MRVSLLVFAAALAGSALAQDKPPAQKVTADRVLALYENAIGLKQLGSIHNLHVKAVLKPAVDRGDRFYSDMDCYYDSAGHMWEQTFTRSGVVFSNGYDGKSYWHSATGMSYPIFFNGQDQSTEQHIPFSSVFLPILSRKNDDGGRFELLGITSVENRKAFVIRGINKSGYSQVLYFDTDTYLLIRADSPAIYKSTGEEPEEGFVVTTYWSEYRRVGKVMLAHRIRFVGPQAENIITVEKVESDVPFQENKFQRPH